MPVPLSPSSCCQSSCQGLNNAGAFMLSSSPSRVDELAEVTCRKPPVEVYIRRRSISKPQRRAKLCEPACGAVLFRDRSDVVPAYNLGIFLYEKSYRYFVN